MSNNASPTRARPAEPPPVEVLWLPPANRQEQRTSLKGPLLVDSSDSNGLEGVLRLAQVLARRDRVKVHVLAVVEPSQSLRSMGASQTTGREVNECRREAWSQGNPRLASGTSMSTVAFEHVRGALLVAPAARQVASVREPGSLHVNRDLLALLYAGTKEPDL